MNIGDLKSGDDILLKVNGAFKPVPMRYGKKTVYETPTVQGRPRSPTFSECTATVIGHAPLNNTPALQIQFVNIVDRSVTGIAHINYFSILSIRLYEGETNIKTVVPKDISDKRDEWPYTAYQLPPSKIYRKKVNLVW